MEYQELHKVIDLELSGRCGQLLATVIACCCRTWVEGLRCNPFCLRSLVVDESARCSWVVAGGGSFACWRCGHRQRRDSWLVRRPHRNYRGRCACGAHTYRSSAGLASSRAPRSGRASPHPASSWSWDHSRHRPDRHHLSGALRLLWAVRIVTDFQAIIWKL